MHRSLAALAVMLPAIDAFMGPTIPIELVIARARVHTDARHDCGAKRVPIERNDTRLSSAGEKWEKHVCSDPARASRLAVGSRAPFRFMHMLPCAALCCPVLPCAALCCCEALSPPLLSPSRRAAFPARQHTDPDKRVCVCWHQCLCACMPGILLDGRRRSSVALDAKAKNKKGGKGEAKAGKDKQAPGAMPAGEKAPKMKKENTDVTGEDPQEIIANVKDKMGKTVENTREALGAIRTGRPSPKMFDKVMVSAYDAETPLPQLATVSIQSASSVMISPFDPSTLGDIEKGILKSELNLTPSNDGATIRINIPPLTTETRAQFAKQASSVAEDGKVALRNIRRTGVDAIRKLEKGSSPISEDESKALQDQVQKLTDKCSTELSDLAKAKEKELNTV